MRKHFLTLFLITILLIGCGFYWGCKSLMSAWTGAPNAYLVAQSSPPPVETSIKTFQTEKGWGYDLYIAGKLFIHQMHIPAVPGNNSFVTEADAYKIAQLTESKLKKNPNSLPTISVEELKNLGVWK